MSVFYLEESSVGKFSSGMKKYGHLLGSAFVSDKEERKQIKRENKLNHAERLAITPVTTLVDPLVLTSAGVGAVALGVGTAAIGILAIPTGLVGRILIGKGNALMAMGGGMVLGGGALAIFGGVVAVEGIISPVLNVGSIPYNGYKAFKHRDRKEHNKDIKNPNEDIIENVENKSSHTKMSEGLGSAVNSTDIDNAPPKKFHPLFEAKNAPEGPAPLNPASMTPSM